LEAKDEAGGLNPQMTVEQTRRTWLKQWFASRTLPVKEKSYLSQLINGKTPFGERAARRLEKDYGMPNMHLDTPLDAEFALPRSSPIPNDNAELLEAWAYLLPAEKAAIMEQIRPMASHNKAVLEHLIKP
jgi:hypothetical protein